MATKVINALTFGDTYVLTTPYATCSTAAGTAAKVATITPGSAFSLETGVRVSVKFTNALSVAAPTLNVNSSGAKAIYFRGATLSSAQYWAAGSTVDFVYDGTYWQMLGSQHNSTYSLSSFGITASATELNYTDGVTSNIQTQLNNKLNLSGGTITGQLDVDTVLRNGNTFYNVLEVARTDTPVEIVVKTKIPYASGNEMPLIHLKGYAYGESAVIEMTVAFYIYSDNYTNYSVVSTCPWKPTVYLSSYTENNVKYVALSFAGSIYYPRFVIDYTDIWAGSSSRDYSSGWTVECRTDTSAASIIPSTNKVTVPYKPIANDISGNASTATNVAWSGVTSKPSYYDAKAIKGITRSGTTFTYTCMDGTTGTFTQQDNNTNTAHSHTAGTGLTISGSGGTSGTTTYSANLNSTTSLGTIGTTSKLYAVGVDSAGKLCVNVPWTDTDTNTDTKVTQNAVITTSGRYPVILGNSTATTAVTNSVNKSATLLFDPSSSTLIVGSTETANEQSEPTGYLYVSGDAIIGGGSDSYGIIPGQDMYSHVGTEDRRWYQGYFYNMYCNNYYTADGSSLTSKFLPTSGGTLTGATTVNAGVALQLNTLKIPTSSGGTTYGVGSSGQVLKSNGSTVYWGSDSNTTYSYPNLMGCSCSTAASTTAKTASLNGFSSTYLKAGATVFVMFTYAHTGSSAATLNINSSGAKTIYRNGKTITSGNANSWTAYEVVKMVYDGTYWQYYDTELSWSNF